MKQLKIRKIIDTPQLVEIEIEGLILTKLCCKIEAWASIFHANAMYMYPDILSNPFQSDKPFARRATEIGFECHI